MAGLLARVRLCTAAVPGLHCCRAWTAAAAAPPTAHSPPPPLFPSQAGSHAPLPLIQRAAIIVMERVTAELCQKQFRHCHEWIEELMQSEQGGSLHQFATLPVLMPRPRR